MRSELDREHGESYRWLFRDENSEQPDTIDPFRMACYMSFKITTLLYFPLMNDVVRFVWSLWHMLVLYLTLVFVIMNFAEDLSSTDENEYHDTFAKDCDYVLVSTTGIAALVATADAILCTACFVEKKML